MKEEAEDKLPEGVVIYPVLMTKKAYEVYQTVTRFLGTSEDSMISGVVGRVAEAFAPLACLVRILEANAEFQKTCSAQGVVLGKRAVDLLEQVGNIDLTGMIEQFKNAYTVDPSLDDTGTSEQSNLSEPGKAPDPNWIENIFKKKKP